MNCCGAAPWSATSSRASPVTGQIGGGTVRQDELALITPDTARFGLGSSPSPIASASAAAPGPGPGPGPDVNTHTTDAPQGPWPSSRRDPP